VRLIPSSPLVPTVLTGTVISGRRYFFWAAPPGIRVRDVSALYESEPMYLREQPLFLNCVAIISTTLEPKHPASGLPEDRKKSWEEDGGYDTDRG